MSRGAQALRRTWTCHVPLTRSGWALGGSAGASAHAAISVMLRVRRGARVGIWGQCRTGPRPRLAGSGGRGSPEAVRSVRPSVAGVVKLVLAPAFKAGGARREALLGVFDSHHPPPLGALDRWTSTTVMWRARSSAQPRDVRCGTRWSQGGPPCTVGPLSPRGHSASSRGIDGVMVGER